MIDKSGSEAILTDGEKKLLDEGWSLTSDVAYCIGGEDEAAERERDARYCALVKAGVLVECPDGQTFARVYHYPGRRCYWCEGTFMGEPADRLESTWITEAIYESALAYIARVRTCLDEIEAHLNDADRELLLRTASNLLSAERQLAPSDYPNTTKAPEAELPLPPRQGVDV